MSRRVLSPPLISIEIGVPPAIVLDEWARLTSMMREVADRFVDVFEQYVAATVDEASLDAVSAVLDRLARLARSVVVAALHTALRERVDTVARRSIEP